MFEGQEEAQRKILNRLKRARGQLDAVISAVEAGGECRDVVTQLSATTKALDRAGFAIVSTAMKQCVVDPETQAGSGSGGAGSADGSGSDDRKGLTIDELEKLFLMLA